MVSNSGAFIRSISGGMGGFRVFETDGPKLHSITSNENEDSDEVSHRFAMHLPRVTGRITRKQSSGRYVSVSYRIEHKGHIQIVTEEDLDTGEWAGLVGLSRPTTPQIRSACAAYVREQGDKHDEIPSVPYLDTETGDLKLPDATSQPHGYLETFGTEGGAVNSWSRILELATPRTLLMLGSTMAGVLTERLNLPAHIVNLVGDPQTGKSTTQQVQAALMGNPENQSLFSSWNTSAQGLPQLLKELRYLPAIREEASSSGLSPEALERLMVSLVSGADRTTGGRDGRVRASLGPWRSALSSSSNRPLRRPGQTEALAARLHEVHSPFWYGGAAAVEAERHSRNAYGWPLHLAVKNGLLTSDGIQFLQQEHAGFASKICPEGSGLEMTIARTHAAWVTGVLMLDGIFETSYTEDALQEAKLLFLLAVDDVQASLEGEDERLWETLEAYLMTEGSFMRWGTGEQAVHGLRKDQLGILDRDEHMLLVTPYHLKQVADGLDIPQALALMSAKGILKRRKSEAHMAIRPSRKFSKVLSDCPSRMYHFDLTKAWATYGSEISGEEELPEPDPAPVIVPPTMNVPESTFDARIGELVAEYLKKAGGDREKAVGLFGRRAGVYATELWLKTRESARYEVTKHPVEPDILQKEGRSDSIWEGIHRWTNPTVVVQDFERLDVNSDFLSAMKVAHLPIGKLQHEPDAHNFDPKRSGFYLISPPAWNHPDLPPPLGNREEPGDLWVGRPTLQLLDLYASEDLCDAPYIKESWTAPSSAVLLRDFSGKLADLKERAKASGDLLTVEFVKKLYSCFVSTGSSHSKANHMFERADWTHLIRSTAYANLHRRAMKFHRAGVTVIHIGGTDEIHVSGDWRAVYPEGTKATEMKVKA